MSDEQDVIEITEGLSKAIGANSGLNSTLKFDFEGKGLVYVDGKSTPNTVSNEDKPADCTITVSLETFKKLAKRELDGTAAFMQGKLKVAGDMSVAMKLGPIFAKVAS
jgi:putative sterol carrier protein